jgi:hypothetical protein
MRALLIALVSASVLACSSGSTANLSVAAKGSAALTAASTTSSLDLGNGISIDRVRVVVRKLKLEGSGSGADGGADAGMLTAPGGTAAASESSGSSSSGGGRDGGDDGKTEVEHESDDASEPVIGPLLADISGTTLAGGLEQVFEAMVPQGTFRELKFAIGPIDAGKAGADAGLAEMAAQHASIIVDGTIDGKAFSFLSGLVAEFQVEGEIVVDDTKANNITLAIDPSAWFGTKSARLDPTDPAAKSSIEGNIKASIRGFEDRDRNGRDDRHD